MYAFCLFKPLDTVIYTGSESRTNQNFLFGKVCTNDDH